MYPCRCTDSETALRIISALRWRKTRKSQSPERVSNSRSSCFPSSAAHVFSFWYRSFLASQFYTTYGEISCTEKRVCLFKCNIRNIQSNDTERMCLTSQIFAVVDFAKHRLGKRRLHLRHCGNIVPCSHGSAGTPTTPQFEHVILVRCMLDDISEITEQK